MKTILITAALTIITLFVTAQENERPVTVRVKQSQIINGKETTTDTTYTVKGPVNVNELGGSTWSVKSDSPKNIIIMTDKISGDSNYVIAGGAGEVIDAEIAKVLNEQGVDNSRIEKTVIINTDAGGKNGKQETKTIKVVIVKKIDMVDPTKEDMQSLGKPASITDDKLAVENMGFYPNPNTGKFNLRFQLPGKGTTSVTILSPEGKTIYSEQLKNFSGSYDKEIDISEHPKGVYFVKIEQGGHTQLKKLVLQ